MRATGTAEEQRGALPDGTPYLIRVPPGWNGILIRDLDFASGVGQPERANRFSDMLARGYAVAGTARHRLRQWQYDPVREIGNVERVHDLFAARFGAPRLVLQYGCSGGGHLGLAMAEAFHDRVGGVIAMGAHTPVWLMNTFLDGWHTLKTLLADHYVAAGFGEASDLRITALPNDGSANPSGHGMAGRLPEAWRNAFRAAQATPEGRARLTLAFAIGQWSPWLAFDTPEPDLADIEAMQAAVYAAALHLAQSPGGEARIMFENAAQGQQLSWNEGIDYRAFLDNAAPAMRRAVESLYAARGMSLDTDIAMINDAPPIASSDYALDFWQQPGRTVRGMPKTPVLRMHLIGDYQVPYTLVQGYAEALEAQGTTEMARILFVKATGHCNVATAESAAAIEMVVRRIETGAWPDADPASANAFAETLGAPDRPRFTALGPYAAERFNRLWIPG